MNSSLTSEVGVPIEHFVQALTSQLDRAQAALALKARAGLPLTFAVKELTLDLRAHVEMVGSVIHVRPAGPGDRDSSSLHFQLTTVTRPMIEENSVQLGVAADEPTLREALGPDVSEEEQRRLEWAGIHNVAQLRDLEQGSGEEALEKFTQVPASRLRAALARASLPRIVKISPEPFVPQREAPPVGQPVPPMDEPPRRFPGVIKSDLLRTDFVSRGAFQSEPPPPSKGVVDAATPVAVLPSINIASQPLPSLVKIRGYNLLRGEVPRVTIGGQPVAVVNATDREIVIAPQPHLLSGTLAVEVAPGVVTESEFDMSTRTGFPPVPPTRGKNGGSR
jgi:hypothetical protein